MSDCEYRERLSAFHDGELDPLTREHVGRHVEACASCTAELRQMRQVTGMFDALAEEPISADALGRVHRAVDRVEDDPPLSILRIAAVLTALAASVLVIGSAWLWEAPGAAAGSRQIVYHPHPTLVWERVAMTLEPDPLPRTAWDVGERTRLAGADARLTDWMLGNLNGRPAQ